MLYNHFVITEIYDILSFHIHLRWYSTNPGKWNLVCITLGVNLTGMYYLSIIFVPNFPTYKIWTTYKNNNQVKKNQSWIKFFLAWCIENQIKQIIWIIVYHYSSIYCIQFKIHTNLNQISLWSRVGLQIKNWQYLLIKSPYVTKAGNLECSLKC